MYVASVSSTFVTSATDMPNARYITRTGSSTMMVFCDHLAKSRASLRGD
jgi:hypothetical protein